MRIEPYNAAQRSEWDDFLLRSRCGTFLFRRAYMDYHAHRFADCSLMARDSRGRLVAMLPANRSGSALHSHQGLTYGGWIAPVRHFNGTRMLEVWEASLDWMRRAGIDRLVYKPLPWIYPDCPAQEDLYALFRFGGVRSACHLSSAFELPDGMTLNESTRQGLALARRSGVEVRESHDFAPFWSLLTDCLFTRHSVRPVHTLEEMSALKASFPDSIRLFTAHREGRLAGGCVMYMTRRVAHVQYMAATPEGREVKALPAVIDHVVRNACAGLRYFDFGSSCEDGGRMLNDGLLLQKSGMGGRGVVYETYTLTLG